jgi:cytidylate kinase
MYRAAAWAALDRDIAVSDEAAVAKLTESLQIDVKPPSVNDGRQCDVLCDGVDVTWAIRSPDVDASVSPVSVYPGVRSALTAQQRRIGLRGAVVMVGRDIGTVVLPEAPLKIYLMLQPKNAPGGVSGSAGARRWSQAYESILDNVKRRDASTAVAPPASRAPDA